jgi:hypothetical protein
MSYTVNGYQVTSKAHAAELIAEKAAGIAALSEVVKDGLEPPKADSLQNFEAIAESCEDAERLRAQASMARSLAFKRDFDYNRAATSAKHTDDNAATVAEAVAEATLILKSIAAVKRKSRDAHNAIAERLEAKAQQVEQENFSKTLEGRVQALEKALQAEK